MDNQHIMVVIEHKHLITKIRCICTWIERRTAAEQPIIPTEPTVFIKHTIFD